MFDYEDFQKHKYDIPYYKKALQREVQIVKRLDLLR